MEYFLNNQKNIYKNFIIFIFVFSLGVYFGDRISSKNISTPIEIRENSDKFQFINPIIITRVSKDFYTEEFVKLNGSLNKNISDLKDGNNIKSISIYFRDMNSGHWTGINEDFKYHPSSMLKVLVLMSYIKRSEIEKDLLGRQLHYKFVDDPGQNYKPKSILPEGYYTIYTLLKQMILYSDNTVLDVLDKEDKDNNFNTAYKVFQLPYAKNIDDIEGFMSPRSYSALFRALYNSAYLSNDHSESVLKILSETDFDNGLIKFIPKYIKVSHKFGEHTYESDSNGVINKELHDCGIVYYPKRPYLACIMTSGTDFNRLEDVVSIISKSIYDYVDNNKIK